MKNTVVVPLLFIAMLLATAPPALRAEENREKDYETSMTKGEFSLENGDHASAIAQFRKAREAKPRDKTAALSLGVAQGRAGNTAEAVKVLREANALDPSDQRIQYELGVALHKTNDLAGALTLLTPLAESADDTNVRTAAKSYLEHIEGKDTTGRFSLSAQAGVQYDSNVILDPVNPIGAPKDRKSDTRAVLSLDGGYRFVDSGPFTATAGYQFYQSVHVNLEDYNVQQHTLSLSTHAALSENATAGLAYSFAYSTVGALHYSTTHQLTPSLDLKLSSGSLTQVHLGFASRRFFNEDAFPTNSDRNVMNSSAGLTHTIQIAKGTGISAGYTYDRDSDAASDVWRSTGNKGAVSFQSDLGPVTLYGSASYIDRQYDASASTIDPKRHDKTQNYLFGLARDLTKAVRLNLSDDYTYNNSNLAAYEYKRNIVGLFVEIRL